MHLRRPAIVACDEAVENLGKEAPLRRTEPPHDAEVDSHHSAGRVHEQIALVHVGMKEAVAHRVREERAQHHEPEFLEIVPRSGDAIAVGERNALDPVGRENALRSPRPVPRPARGSGHRPPHSRHLRHGGGLEPEIHLEFGRPREIFDDGDRLQPARGRMNPLDEAGCKEIAVEIALEPLLYSGAEDFHRHRAPLALPVEHDGLMHLRDRSRCNRRPELDEQLYERLADCSSMARRASSKLKGGMRSWNCAGLPAISGPMMSPRVARNWPSLM